MRTGVQPVFRSISTLSLIVFALLCAALTYYGGYWLSHTADSFYHIKASSELVANNQVLVTNVFTPFEKGCALDITAGTWHTVLALLSLYTGLEIPTVLHFISGLCTLFLILAFHSLTIRIVGNRIVAIIIVILYFLLSWKLNFTVAAYPNRVAYVLLWSALLILLRYVSRGKVLQLLVVGLLAVALSAFHLAFYEAFVLVSMLFAFLLVLVARQRGWGPHVRRLWLALLVAIALSSPFVLLKSSSTYHSPINLIQQVTHSTSVTTATQRISIGDTAQRILRSSWQVNSSFSALVLLLLPLFLLRKEGVLLLSQCSLTFLVAIVFLLLTRVAGMSLGTLNYHLARLEITRYASLIACGYGFQIAVGKRRAFQQLLRRGFRLDYGYYALILLAIVALLAWGVTQAAPQVYRFYRSNSMMDYQGVAFIKSNSILKTHTGILRFIDDLPSGSVILSDPRTSYELVSLTRQYTVAVPGSHMPLGLERSRTNDVWDFLYQNTSVVEAARILEKYHVDYVLAKPFFAERVKELPLLEEIATFHDGLVLFHYRRERLRETLQLQLIQLSPVLEVGGVEITARGVDAEPVYAPGSFLVALDWRSLNTGCKEHRFLICLEEQSTGMLRVSQEIRIRSEQRGKVGSESLSKPVFQCEFVVILPNLLPEGTYSLIMREEASSRGVQIGSIDIFPQHDFEAESFVGVQFSKKDLTGNKTGWWLFERGFYSSGATALTKAVDSVISKSIQDLSGGTYEIALRVYDYGNSELNQLAVAIDSDQKIISWRANREGLRWVTTTVSIKGEMAKELVIRSVEFNPCIVLDIVSVKKVE